MKSKYSEIYELTPNIIKNEKPAGICLTTFIFNETYTTLTLSYKS